MTITLEYLSLEMLFFLLLRGANRRRITQAPGSIDDLKQKADDAKRLIRCRLSLLFSL